MIVVRRYPWRATYRIGSFTGTLRVHATGERDAVLRAVRAVRAVYFPAEAFLVPVAGPVTVVVVRSEVS